MKKVAILGGSFDPITNAHLYIGEEVSKKLNCEVWYMPAKISRWKKNKPSSATDRMNMLRLALTDKPNFSICDVEINQKENKVTYTVETMLTLLDNFKGYKFYYIIGTDQLLNLPKWKDIDILSTLVTFAVVEREGYKLDKDLLKKYNCKDLHIKLPNISSTAIRAFESDESPKEVLGYIKQKGLYIKPSLQQKLTKDRYEHSLRVAKLARQIAISNGYDKDEAYLAGLVHDCAKNIKLEKMIEMMLEHEPDKIGEATTLYHQYLAPVVASERYHIDNQTILDAIKYHTTGRLNMSTLDKIIYCADKIEPGREYDSSFLINKCLEDINVGFMYTYTENQMFVRKKHNVPLPEESLKVEQECIQGLEQYELETLVKLLDDRFAFDIKVYNVASINPLTKYVINCSCSSDRQVNAVAELVEDCLIENHFDFHHKEIQKNSSWSLIDGNSFVINVFRDLDRPSYGFEEIYKDLEEIDISKWLS